MTTAYCSDFYGNSRQEITVRFWEENLSQETLVMEVGFPGDGAACTASGVRMGYDSEQGYTKYRFTLPEGAAAQELDLEMAFKDIKGRQSAFQVNQRKGITDDPTPCDAIFYLEHREPAQLPLCSRTMSLYSTFLYHPVWRAEFAVPLSGLCAGLPEIHEDVSAPGLPGQRTGDILSLYRMGILRGLDEAGTFGGREWLTRRQAAIIAWRVLDALQSG